MADWASKHIRDWISQKQPDIVRAWEQKGGWEGWLQVELALYLEDLLGREVKVSREDRIYHGTHQQVDLALQPGNIAPMAYYIELKAEGQCRLPADFWQVVKKDLEKVCTGTLADGFQKGYFWSMNFFSRGETWDKYSGDMEKYAEAHGAHFDSSINLGPIQVGLVIKPT